MEFENTQAGGGKVPIQDEIVPPSASTHFVQDAGISSSGNSPSPLAETQAKFRIFPIEEKTLV
jgi:hypothetical protein